jgi:hypothetical protein
MRRLFITLAKLIGLLQLYWAIVTVVQIGSFVDILLHGDATTPYRWHFATLMGTVFYLVLSLGAAWVCIKKTDWLANKLGLPDSCASGEVVVKEGDLLRTGVKLIGVYILAYAIPAFVRTMFGYGLFSGGKIGTDFWTNIIPSALQLFLGAFLAIRSERLIAFISTAEQTAPRRIFLTSLGFFVLVLLLGLAVSSQRSDDYNTYQTGTVISTTTTTRGCVDLPKSANTNTAYGVDWSKPKWHGEQETNEQSTTNWQDLKIRVN